MNLGIPTLVFGSPWMRALARSTSGGFADPVTPLHLASTTTDMTFAFIVLGGIASSVLASASVLAFSQRRSRPYLFVSLALGMLAAKAFVGGLTAFGFVPGTTHHLIEHALDFATALLLITAVVFARMESDGFDDRPRREDADDDRVDTDFSNGFEQ
ncbi:hypothetical protein V5735_21855 (plasmid) [Haladaptatus sp. SPP-AMP-3]|uniref:DUF7471 family protein n=1 Tax=Haladaptatus sp. SPP-AMP-3 TaxID=3121295 RepID=UPI003C2EEFEC